MTTEVLLFWDETGSGQYDFEVNSNWPETVMVANLTQPV